MSLVIIPQSKAPEKEKYRTNYLKFKGLVEKVPVLASALEAKAEAVTASWRTHGNRAKEAAEMLDEFSGNGKQSFKTIIHNMFIVSKISGNAYAEIVWNEDLGIENLRVLHPDDITINIDNGKIDSYEDKNSGEEFEPQDIFHLMNNPVGAQCYGNSEVEILNDLCLDWAQLVEDTSELMHRNIKPVDTIEIDSDTQAEMQRYLDAYTSQKNKRGVDIAIPKGIMSLVKRPSYDVNPEIFNRMIIDQIMMRTRVPELALGTGSVNSEESAKMQFMGFRQAVRWEQKVLEEAINSQILMPVFPKDKPKIKWSFATEAQEESFNRLMQQFTTINSSGISDDLKGLLLLQTLNEAGVIEDVGKERERKGKFKVGSESE